MSDITPSCTKPCPACKSVATHNMYRGEHDDMWCSICGCRFPSEPLIYTPPTPIDMAALCLVAGIERPCKALRINFEDWGRLNFPCWCGLVPIHPTDTVDMNSIEAVRGE